MLPVPVQLTISQSFIKSHLLYELISNLTFCKLEGESYCYIFLLCTRHWIRALHILFYLILFELSDIGRVILVLLRVEEIKEFVSRLHI